MLIDVMAIVSTGVFAAKNEMKNVKKINDTKNVKKQELVNSTTNTFTIKIMKGGSCIWFQLSCAQVCVSAHFAVMLYENAVLGDYLDYLDNKGCGIPTNEC
jgi:hypothetical protein